MPRYQQPDAAECENFYRAAVGVDDNGAAVADAKDVSTYAHMFGLGDALRHQAGDGGGRLPGPGRPPGVGRGDRGDDRRSPEGNEHPQGDKIFNGKIHQVFGHQIISKVEGGKLKVVHTTAIEDGLYPDEATTRRMSVLRPAPWIFGPHPPARHASRAWSWRRCWR